MTFEEIQQRLAGKFGERLPALAPANKDAFLVVQPGDVVEICRFLKEEPDLAFDCLMNLSTIDWPKKNQIEVVYHLFSYAKLHSFILKAQLDRAKPEIASLVPLWKAADWLEREQYDLMGVTFTGHPDLRRIMLPDDWVGHPLLKDYKEPGDYHRISHVRESPLDGFVRLDELTKKTAAEKAAQGVSPEGAEPKKELLQ